MPKESQPGRTTGVLPRPVVLRENPSNHVFVDLDVERQGHLLSDSRTAPVGIPLVHCDDRTVLGTFGPGFRRRFWENSIRYFRLHKAL